MAEGCVTSLEAVRSCAFSISNHIICLSLLTPLASGAELRGTPLVLKSVCNQQPEGFNIVNVCIHKGLDVSISILNGLL